jgi:aminobenzoyl-glutamate transport protein
LSAKEKKGLLMAALTLLGIVAVTLVGIIPENGFFRGSDGGLLSSPLIRGVVAMLLSPQEPWALPMVFPPVPIRMTLM